MQHQHIEAIATASDDDGIVEIEATELELREDLALSLFSCCPCLPCGPQGNF